MGSAATEAPGPQPQRHASTSRRPRIASLPNPKSPFSIEHAQSRRKDENNPTSLIRTTLHGQEDLRSYEAAVLARKTPTLSLGPRARRNNTIFSQSEPDSKPSSATGPPMMAHWSGSGGSDREGMRPSCKRLPSQTLGPFNTKRAQVSHEELGGRPSSTSSSGVPQLPDATDT
ncbi:hypothetical protein M378DRAFT_17163 [Amanita muscaria Koide BX008]|uniref:Uncharacterized protein n=1 Tax=Amanita muscaria (strain Koide BX008) TaxID=946122 RepID=A0A0C2WI74_AMAMK|nr:hypothetical protein M378DRAFT_17163 [Amanita muscaria Koide BX008]